MKFARKASFLLPVTGALLLATQNSIESASAILQLSGTVTSVAELEVTPTALATALTLSEGVVNQKVATINERSNNLLGYTVSLTSANAVAAASSTPTLVRTGGGGETPIYTLTYNNLPVVFLAGNATITPLGILTGAGGVNKDLNITLAPGQVFTQGTYTDTLTLTLTNN
jgi:hypothetical protein